MRFWWIPVAACVVLIGCAGATGDGGTTGGNSGGGSSGGGATAEYVAPLVSLSDVGQIQYTALSGQGRDIGSQIAVIRNTEFRDSVGLIPTIEQNSLPDIRMQLDGYTHNGRVFSVAVPSDRQTRFFETYDLEIYRLEEIIDDNGDTQTLTSQLPAFRLEGIDTEVRVFPGRQTTIQIRLDDEIVKFDGTNLVFDEGLFLARNYTNGAIRSFLSDYISFDLTAMAVADRPTMTSGSPAEAVLFSGDGIALRSGFGSVGSFELLQPIKIEQGVINPGDTIGDDISPGSYSVLQNDPRDFTGTDKIVALKGIWRNYEDVFSQTGEFTIIALPESHDIDNDDEITNEQQIVMFRYQGGKVRAMYQGKVVYKDTNNDGKPDTGDISVWPINQVDDADASNQINGTVKNLTIVADASTPGKFNVKAGTVKISNPPSGFPSDGTFVVFRR